MKGLIGLITLALFAVIIVGTGKLLLSKYNYYVDFNEAYDPNDTKQIEFTVSRGESYNSIGERLQQEGIIEDAQTFIYKTKLNELGPKYQAGTFLLSPSMTMVQITNALQDAKRETIRFTIPEGYTVVQTAQKLEADGIANAEEIYKALESFDPSRYWFLTDLKEQYADPQGILSAKANMYEGFLFPDTYEIYKGSTAETILIKMFDRFDQVFTEDMRAKLRERGITVQECVTMASLIERECRVDDERPLIASVINNRLAKGMNLELDCAIQYILGNPKEGLLYSDLEIESPYNIYKHGGLTPGPIASPGVSSMNAVLEPADTNYYFYVLQSQSSINHNFAETYDQFLEYKAIYKNTK